MTDLKQGPGGSNDRSDDRENPLLTPQERDVLRLVRELRLRSDRLVRRSAYVNRSKELRHYFPPPPFAPRPSEG